MPAESPEPSAADPMPGDVSAGHDGSRASSGPEAGRGPRLWRWAIAAGLVAGLLSWAGGERAQGSLRAAQAPGIVAFPTGADHDRVIRGLVDATARSFLQQGAILGVVLGLAGGLARRSIRGASAGALVGLASGLLLTAGAAYALLPIYYRNVEPQDSDLMSPLLTHGGIWGAAGLAAGLAFGFGLGGGRDGARGALGGLLGAIAATLIYDVVGALAFPVDKTSQPVSATVVTRAFAQLAVALLVAAGAAYGIRSARATRRPPPAPAAEG